MAGPELDDTPNSPDRLNGDARQRALYWEKWSAAGRQTRAELGDQGAFLLDRIFGHSPFLSECALKEPAVVEAFAASGADAAHAVASRDLPDHSAMVAMTPAEAARNLRIVRRRFALAVALADISGAWSVEQVLGTWSGFAEQLLQAATSHLLGPDARQSGYAIIALGKLGSRELNYSSDIDLAIFYDRQSPAFPVEARDGKEARFFTRVTQRLVNLFQERTENGYLFRMDLRLRPDPGSTPLAVSVEAAELYYGAMAQNWERAVFIRARPIAGDVDAGARFLSRIAAFVWRRNLDFSAVRDIQAMQRQAGRGDTNFNPAGFHLKFGGGGIRSIEFHLHTQQLVWGGRNPSLRCGGTADGLRALADAGRIEAEVAEQLIDHYHYLRTVENRLQMIRDEQTHVVPEDLAERTRLASFLGHQELSAFEAELGSHVRAVQALTATGGGAADSLVHPYGNLVFTGVDPDPGTIATLARLGFRKPESVIAQIANWHRGRIPATRTERGRALLTELTPSLLGAIGEAPDPEAAFAGFARFLEGLNAGVELLSMFADHPSLMSIVAEIMGSAPELGQTLTANPRLLDQLLDLPLEAPLPDAATIEEALDTELELGLGDYQDDLDAFRRWAGELRFSVALKLLCGVETSDVAASVLTHTADIAIRRLMGRVGVEFEAVHGRVPGGGAAFLALGKLGGRTLLPGSDLDGVFFYDAPPRAVSDGAKPLAASVYFTRFAHRLITGFTAHTAAGRLWEFDLLLRPHGRAGPLASPLRAYEAYLAKDAWPVEKLALVRSRVVAGAPETVQTLDSIIARALTAEGKFDALASDLLELRAKIKGTHRPSGPFDVKHAPGGLLDLELLAQYLALTTAQRTGRAIRGSTIEVVQALKGEGVLANDDAKRLIGIAQLYQAVQTMLRITVGHRNDPESISPPLIERFGRAVGLGETEDLLDILVDAQVSVRFLIEKHITGAANR